MNSQLTTIGAVAAADVKNTLGESPLWDWRTKLLYWVDVREPSLFQLDPANNTVQKWTMPEEISAVLLRRDSELAVALKSGLFSFCPSTENLSPLFRVHHESDDMRLNDCAVDREGTMWVSTMVEYGAEARGILFRLFPDLTTTIIREGISIPNALAFSHDGKRGYFADTKVGAIEQIDLCHSSKALEFSPFVDAGVEAGLPDGATCDENGNVWNARYGGGAIGRFSVAGKNVGKIELPASQPTSCAFGGKNLDQLYVTTATQGLTDSQLESQKYAGTLLVLEAGIRGNREPVFIG